MIRHFKDKHTKVIFDGGAASKKWHSIQRQAERRLQILDKATCLNDLKNLPGNRFELLRGDRKGQYSIRINIQWRLCFRWDDNRNEAYDVEIVDYH